MIDAGLPPGNDFGDEAADAARPLFFISDLHLSDAIPNTVAAFEHFVNVTANDADSVFVLGDLFEFWVGDDVLDPSVNHERATFARRMAALMHTLSERGIALYVSSRRLATGSSWHMATRYVPTTPPISDSAALHAIRWHNVCS
jgi:UDP-2,3-diacylglucosamine hydrolase